MDSGAGTAVGTVTRIGLTPVKGLAHLPLDSLHLPAGGPASDRAFCLVDPATGRVLRTVENDRLLACRARWEPPSLTIATPDGDEVRGTVPAEDDASGAPAARPRVADYWGRDVRLVDVKGPFAGLLGRYLDREVVLCRIVRPAVPSPQPGVVWGGAVSLVTTSSLAEVARRTGRVDEDGVRFRATFVVGTGTAPAFVEDAWAGRQLRIGDAVVAVRGPLPRCALVDRRPGSGERDVRVLEALAPDRTSGREILFGMDADVVSPGTAVLGSDVLVTPAG